MNASDRGVIIVIALLFSFGAGCFAEAIWSQNAAPGLSVPYVVPYFAPPDQLALCGEAVPLDVPEVKERLDREFTIVVYSHAQVYLWLKRMQRYFPWLERELARNGLPNDLKYVAVAESDLQISASSPAGAVGPWQFIRSTGANYGLAQSEGIDERRDFEKSTQSAFKYLRDLRELFQNWTLALASYNCGERRVQDEMKKQKVSSYYRSNCRSKRSATYLEFWQSRRFSAILRNMAIFFRREPVTLELLPSGLMSWRLVPSPSKRWPSLPEFPIGISGTSIRR